LSSELEYPDEFCISFEDSTVADELYLVFLVLLHEHSNHNASYKYTDYVRRVFKIYSKDII